MLEEMQGAGLGWDHPFVQCRMQGAIFSLRNSVLMPAALCADIAPDPEVLDPHSPLAFVRFTPPNDDYADEVYSPPEEQQQQEEEEVVMKHQPPHGFDDRYAAAARNDDFYQSAGGSSKTKRTGGRRNIDDTELVNRIKDIKNRIELRRMMAEYEAGNLQPPIYYRANGDDYQDDDVPDEQFFRPDDKRAEQPARTSFREMARHQPEQEFEQTNELPLEPLKLNHLVQSNEQLSPESGVYTEGGLVYVPDSDSKSHAACKYNLCVRSATSNILLIL